MKVYVCIGQYFYEDAKVMVCYDERPDPIVPKHRDSIATPEGIIGIITTRAPPMNAQGVTPTGVTLPAGTVEKGLAYWLKDHLGSVSIITDESGNITQRFRYDPWGKRQCASGGTSPLTDNCLAQSHEERGFTGHEMLDEVGLIHMNGRLYDHNTARFLQADPIIQDPLNSQSYNRYTYVQNNPLSFTDPSGFSWWTKWRKTIFAIVAAIVVTFLTAGLLTSLAVEGTLSVLAADGGLGSIVLSSTGNAIAAMAGGFAAGGIQGGNLKSAVIGAVTAGLTFGVGEMLGHATSTFAQNASQYAAKAAAHAAVGCASAAAAGGSCKAGAMAAGFSSLAGPYLPGGGTESFNGANMLGKMVVGGIASKLGGGKFENGAMTAAMQYLFNDVIVRIWSPRLDLKQVGHVMLTDEYDNTLQSQFPRPTGLRGPNTTLSLDQTIQEEGRQPDHVYRIAMTSNQMELTTIAALNHTQRTTWFIVPVPIYGTNFTNCSASTYDILSAATPYFAFFSVGIPAPWTIKSTLDILSSIKSSGVTKIGG